MERPLDEEPEDPGASTDKFRAFTSDDEPEGASGFPLRLVVLVVIAVVVIAVVALTRG